MVCGPGSNVRQFCQAFFEGRFCRYPTPGPSGHPFFNGMLATGKHFDWKIRCALQYSPGEGIFQLPPVLLGGGMIPPSPTPWCFSSGQRTVPCLILSISCLLQLSSTSLLHHLLHIYEPDIDINLVFQMHTDHIQIPACNNLPEYTLP